MHEQNEKSEEIMKKEPKSGATEYNEMKTVIESFNKGSIKQKKASVNWKTELSIFIQSEKKKIRMKRVNEVSL